MLQAGRCALCSDPRIRLIDFVDGDNDRYARRFGVTDGFHRLRHDGIIRSDHEDDTISVTLSAAGAHLRKGRVAWRIKKCDLAIIAEVNLIRANMLGDAAGFA